MRWLPGRSGTWWDDPDAAVSDAARWAVERLSMKLLIFGMGYTAQTMLRRMAHGHGPAMSRDDPKPRKRRAALATGRADGAHVPRR
jgi:hypothetical protein